MKRTFLTILPIAAALLLATSCSKDSDSNVAIDPVETQNITSPTESSPSESKTIPFSITVGKGSETLSKATVEVEDDGDKRKYIQKFETGDQLVLKNGETEVATLDLAEGDGQSTATFSGELKAEVTSGTSISVTLTNSNHGNTGEALAAPQSAASLAEAFQKYGYWTSSFTYTEGENPTIQLVQNTVFLKIKPFSDGDGNATVNSTEYTAGSDGTIYLAVASGTAIASNLFSGIKTVTNEEGKVVKNINRSTQTSNDIAENSLTGKFSVSATKKVSFSKGNLQATTNDNGKNWTFGFANSQSDCIGKNTANTKINGDGTVSENGTVDLFGWVGASSTWTGAAQYGISNSETFYSTETYGNVEGEALKSDWGTLMGDGSTWQTLSKDEWSYLFNSRTNASDLYGHGSVGDKNGLIILPDSWTLPTGLTFTSGTSEWANSYTTEQWSQMESAGAVFLPAASNRSGSDVNTAGYSGFYWSSSAYGTNSAYGVYFASDELKSAYYRNRYQGFSVRLVRSVD